MATLLSDRFRCPALGVAIYDDDVLLLGRFENRTQTVEHNRLSGKTLRPKASAGPSRSPLPAFRCGPSSACPTSRLMSSRRRATDASSGPSGYPSGPWGPGTDTFNRRNFRPAWRGGT